MVVKFHSQPLLHARILQLHLHLPRKKKKKELIKQIHTPPVVQSKPKAVDQTMYPFSLQSLP